MCFGLQSDEQLERIKPVKGVHTAYREQGKQKFSCCLQQLILQRTKSQFSLLCQRVAKKNHL